MKEGMEIGQNASFSVVVTRDMFAQFEGKVVHEAFSTVSMVYYMEWAARQIILPYLEAHEEGIGGGVTVKHLGISGEGDSLQVTATLTKKTGRKIVTKVLVEKEKQVVGEGEVIQFILDKKEIEKKLKPFRI